MRNGRTSGVDILLASLVIGFSTAHKAASETLRGHSNNSKDVRTSLLKAIQCPRNSSVLGSDEKLREPSVHTPIENIDGMSWERWIVWSEPSQVGKVPVVVVKPSVVSSSSPLPCIIVLHGTGGSKYSVRDHLVRYAKRGFVAVSFDSRYHGERGDINKYFQALVIAWKQKGVLERPFIFDVVWDCLRVLDMLVSRDDIDASRIGITGISLGGMIAWFAAAVDPRIAVAAPAIGVQSFRFALETNQWHARVDSIRPVFEEAAADMGKNVIDAEVVRAVWDAITPGLIDEFDAASSLCLIAPRPLFVVNGLHDPRCPAAGVQEAFYTASKCWNSDHSQPKLLLEEGVAHDISPNMWRQIDDFFMKHLSTSAAGSRSEL